MKLLLPVIFLVSEFYEFMIYSFSFLSIFS